MIGFFLTNRDKYYTRKIAFSLNSNDTKVNKIFKDVSRTNEHLNSKLDFHIRNLQHYFEKTFDQKRFNNTLAKENFQKGLKMKNYFDFYLFDKTIKKLSRKLRKIDKILRNYLSVLDDNLTRDILHSHFDFNEIISQIKKVQEIKQNMFSTNNVEKNLNQNILENYLFLYHEQLILRLFSAMLITHKNSTDALNILSKDNIDFILNYSRDKLLSELKKTKDINESIIYFVKRIFLNHSTSNAKDYYYSDFLIELNRGTNFLQYFFPEDDSADALRKNNSTIKVDKDDAFEYDIVFISGLNSEFSKTWRVPKDKLSSSLVDYLQFLLHGKHIEKVYGLPSYELWIPKMFEAHTFKDKNIRYLVTNVETKFFPFQLSRLNIPDYTIDEIAHKICNTFSAAGVGKRPFVIVSHSMGGLICKKIINRLETNGKLVDNKNLRGVVFFSTPHFGTNITYNNILDIAISKYFKFYQVCHTTSSEYGLHEDDLKETVALKCTKATTEICFQSKEEFEKEHLDFRKIGVKYICINETHGTYFEKLGQRLHIVDPESCYLPETSNYFLENKIHSDVQKFSPENFEEEGYKILTLFIKDALFNNNEDKIIEKH